MDHVSDLAAELLVDTLEKALTRPPAPAPSGEDREDKVRHFVPNVLIPAEQNRVAEKDRDDDR